MIKGVLFDMDGVLFDTERLGLELMPQIAARMGYTMPDELYMRILGTSTQLSGQVLREVYGEDFPYDELMREFLSSFVDIARRGELPMKPGVEECMAGLMSRGLKRALVTSTDRDIVDIYLENTPVLRNAFDVVICGTEVERSKPAPDIYLTAARRAGVAPEDCVGVEDSRNGLKSLTAAGCVRVMIPDLLPFDESFHGLTDYILKDLNALCPLIDRLGLGARVRGGADGGRLC